MGIILGLAAAFGFGVADITGGLATRRCSPFAVLVYGEAASVVLFALLCLVLPPESLSFADLLLGVATGLTQVVAMKLLLQALARGVMGVVSATTAVMATSVAVVWSVLRGETLSTLDVVGIVFAFIAIALVVKGPESREEVLAHRKDVFEAALAGIFFGIGFVTLGSASEESQLVPMVAARVVSAAVSAVILWHGGESLRIGRRDRQLSVINGLTASLALSTLIVAVRIDSAAVWSVLQSLAPVATTFFAFVFIRQRLRKFQLSGLVVAVASVTMFAL